MKRLGRYLLISFTFLLLGHSVAIGRLGFYALGSLFQTKKVHSSGWDLKESYCTYKKVFNPVAFYIVLGHSIPVWRKFNHTD